MTTPLVSFNHLSVSFAGERSRVPRGAGGLFHHSGRANRWRGG